MWVKSGLFGKATQLIPVEVRPHVGAAVPGLVILLIPRKRLGPLKGCLAVNRIRI